MTGDDCGEVSGMNGIFLEEGGGKSRPVREADKLSAIYEPII
jgi:hypothetical protein